VTDDVLVAPTSTWRCSWQDFRGHVPGIGAKKPKVKFQDFPTKSEADAHKARVRSEGRDVISCVTLTPPPKKKKKA